MTQFKLKENLYFDRKENLLTFNKSQGKVLVCKSGVTITFQDLLSFLERYIHVDKEHPEKHLTEDVTNKLNQLNVLVEKGQKLTESPEKKKISIDLNKKKTSKTSTPKIQEKKKASATPKLPPSAKIQSISDRINKQIIGKVTQLGSKAIAEGQLDDDIQNIVEELSRELKPRQILSQLSSHKDKESDENKIVQRTIASQSFGNKLNLSEKDLFLIAKSALLFGLKEQERQNIPIIKENLLSDNPSASLSKRLKHSYQEITKWLKQQKVDPEISTAINQSQFIYYTEPANNINDHAAILGITDSFLTLKSKKIKLLIIEDILVNRLNLVANEAPLSIKNLVELIQESCYNEYRVSHLKQFSGGDHCAFQRLDKLHFGILIFDVSGHDEEASDIRDKIVDFLSTIGLRKDPSIFANLINNFLLDGNFPEDRFVSLLYGVINIEEDVFVYANAGHNPPYLVSKNKLFAIKENDLLLNISPYQYSNHKINLQQGDSLVLYTDGLTEARKTNQGEMFGTNRLEKTLSEKNLEKMKAKKAVSTILSVIDDEGFNVEDDITIQVYRHL